MKLLDVIGAIVIFIALFICMIRWIYLQLQEWGVIPKKEFNSENVEWPRADCKEDINEQN